MFRKLLVATVLAATTLVGLLSTAGPASAATSVSACFRWDRGAVYANQPVNLLQWNGSSWVVIRNGRTNGYGCGTFSNVPSGAYTSMQASTRLGNTALGFAIYVSTIDNWATPGRGGVNLGTKVVNLIRCTEGYSGYCAGL